MKKNSRSGKWWAKAFLAVGLCAAAAGLGAVAPAEAHGPRHGHPRVFVGVAPPWWGPGYPYRWHAPLYYAPPPIIVERPRVYVEPQPEVPTPAQPFEWYYCPNTKAYYPYVRTCTEPWVKVPARPE
jgi:hypothetical protein